MASLEIGSVWKLMSKYKFLGNDNPINEDLLCVICKTLIIDAVVSNACGCQYCYKCINEHTRHEKKYCPGNTDFCHDEPIVLGVNSLRSTVLNKRISKLKVQCPNESCACNIELIAMDDHLRLCTKQPVGCPYSVIGCDSESANKNTIESHLQVDALAHAELLIVLIQTLKNEVSGLRNELEKRWLEFECLQEESRSKESRIVKLEAELKQTISEIEMKVNTERSEREEDSNEKRQIMNNKIESLMSMANDNKDNSEKNRLDIIFLKKESKQKENNIVLLEKQLRQVINETEVKLNMATDKILKQIDEHRHQIDFMNKEKENLSTIIIDLKTDMDKMREERKTYDADTERRVIYWIKWNRLCPNIDEDFGWKINQCTSKINTELFSEPFYSNNCKWCLYMYNDSHYDNIWLRCYIMKGDNDSKVPWPIKRTVTLSIVDQVTMMAVTSATFNSAFDVPKMDMCGYVGTASFIKYSSIKDKVSIIVDDSIVITCMITNP